MERFLSGLVLSCKAAFFIVNLKPTPNTIWASGNTKYNLSLAGIYVRLCALISTEYEIGANINIQDTFRTSG
jgi:hypothetical protein